MKRKYNFCISAHYYIEDWVLCELQKNFYQICDFVAIIIMPTKLSTKNRYSQLYLRLYNEMILEKKEHFSHI